MPQPATIADFTRVADEFWPLRTAEPWDRVGLVSGSYEAPLRRVLLAVDATTATIDEAIERGADALFTHHPLLLRGIHTVAEDTAKGALLARLIRANVALYAAHTNADQPEHGVSDVIAQKLGLRNSEPIVVGEHEATGLGRVGVLETATTLADFARRIAAIMPQTVTGVRVAGDPERLVRKVALLGGAGDSLLEHSLVRSADVYLTSDLRHHPAQESLELSAVAGGPALIDVAHWSSESLWLEGAAARLGAALPDVEFHVSTLRTDPWSFSIGASESL